MGLESIYINGQTPLDEEEKEDLKIKTISTRGELDEFEQANIEKAIEWTLKINPFPNGNGRHSRLCADILISKGLKGKVFTWGSQNITEKGVTRSKYLNAIYEADKENIIPLLDFART